jgi:hypothetical protein
VNAIASAAGVVSSVFAYLRGDKAWGEISRAGFNQSPSRSR